MTAQQIEQLAAPNYLANLKVIFCLLHEMTDRLLRHFLTDLEAGRDGTEFGEDAALETRTLARILLGQNPRYITIPWFSPGQIDVHLAKVEALDVTDPESRVFGAITRMLFRVMDIVAEN
jgi:hypothetical protein